MVERVELEAAVAALAGEAARRDRAAAAALEQLAGADGDALLGVLADRAAEYRRDWRLRADEAVRAGDALVAAADDADRAWARVSALLAAAAERQAELAGARPRPRSGTRGWFARRRRPSATHAGWPAAAAEPAAAWDGTAPPSLAPSGSSEPLTPPAAAVWPPTGRVAGRADHAGTNGTAPHAPPAAPPAADLVVHLLGPLRVERSGRPVERWGGATAERVTRLLLARAPQRTRRDVLVELLWPEVEPEVGRRRLQQAVYVARRSLSAGPGRAPAIVFERDAYAVNPALTLWRDVDEFERAVAAAAAAEHGPLDAAIDALAAAERAYTGDYLSDEPYEDWTLAERDRLRLLYLDVANRLGALYERRGAFEDALDAAQRVLAHDPCEEEAHRLAMRCHAALGHRNLALRQYRSCVESLRRAYDLGPSPETEALERRLLTDGAANGRPLR